MNLFARFEAVATAEPGRLALQGKEATEYRRLTYGEVARRARMLGAALVRAGLAPGDRVALISENRPEWAVAYFAVMAAGGTAVPLDVQLADAEVANVLSHAECRMAIASGKQAARLLAAPLAWIVDLDARANGERTLALQIVLRDSELADRPLPRVERDALASILYTSGTTGTPKGVMLSHGNFLANVESVMKFRLVNAQDNLLSVLPLHHAFPFTVQLILLFTGARITFPASLKGPDLLACMHETGVTVLVAVPQLFYLLHKGIFDRIGGRPLLVRALLRLLLRLSGALRSSGINLGRLVFGQVHRRFGGRIRIMASGGARLDPLIARDFLALGFTLTEGYGLTETAPVVAFNPLDRVRPGSVGVPLPGVDVQIVNADAEGVGEIAIRGPNVMRGYYRHPEATADVMRDGEWFLSGDLGYRTPDGYIVITGRAKEVIVLSSGKNLYPEEIEEQYLKSAYIKEICLIPQTSDRAGAAVEGVLALVLPDLDVFRAKGLTNIAETIRWDMENVGRDLPAYKRPTGLRIVKEGFPRTRLGKIQRHLVQQRFREDLSREERPIDVEAVAETELAAQEDEVGRKVLAHLREATGKAAVRLDDNLELDLGLDSLARVEMLVALEALLDVKIADDAAAELFTVREVLEHLRTLRTGGTAAGSGERRRGWSGILAETPPEVAALVDASNRPSATLITAFSRGICIAVLRGIYRVRVDGLEHVPQTGPLILVANHCSYFDAFILATVLPYAVAQQVFYLGFEWFFRNRILAWWARGVRVIPVDMDNYLIRALQASARVLRDGKILCLFPEGERSADGQVRTFRKGAGILVRELRAPVLPAHIAGAFEAWPRGQSWPRLHPLHVRFGPVVSPADLLGGDGPRGTDDTETVVLRLRERVIALGADVRTRP